MLPDYLRVLAEPGRCQKFLDPVYASVPVFPRIVFLLVLLNEQTIWILHASLGLHAPVFDGGKERGMVAFGLVRIGLGEVSDGLVERILASQVAADLCRVTGARVR